MATFSGAIKIADGLEDYLSPSQNCVIPLMQSGELSSAKIGDNDVRVALYNPTILILIAIELYNRLSTLFGLRLTAVKIVLMCVAIAVAFHFRIFKIEITPKTYLSLLYHLLTSLFFSTSTISLFVTNI